MNDPVERKEVLVSLTNAAKEIGRLAQHEDNFEKLVKAYRAVDAKAFQRLLTESKIIHCEEVCFWLRSKECVLECIEFCGVPKEPFAVRDVSGLAELMVKLTSQENEKQLARLAEIVEKRDAAGFKKLAEELKFGRYCYFICHWVCMIYWRLVCEVICSREPVKIRPLAAELSASGRAIAALAKDRQKLEAAVQAAVAQDCIQLANILGNFEGGCFYICEWICSWHCVLACWPRCHRIGIAAESSVREIRAFAAACGELAERGGISKLLEAELASNQEAFEKLIREYKLERFCWQLCHWFCFTICRRFCICVCPPPGETHPLFTHVGDYRVDPIWGDFAANGTTSAQGWAFTGTIDLIGDIPDGSAPVAIEYRFTFKNLGGGGVIPITGAMIPPTSIGDLQYQYWDSVALAWKWTSAPFTVNGAVATVPIPQQFGPALTGVLNVIADPSGWIQIPQANNNSQGGTGKFVPTGILAKLDTTKLTFESFDLTVAVPPLPLKAGDAMPAAQESVKPTFTINFEAQQTVGPVPLGGNSLPIIALSNTAYKYNLHPDWAGSPPNPPQQSPIVLSLDILELIAGGGCNPLTTDVHALYTAYHPYIEGLRLYIQGPLPLPPEVDPVPSALGEAHSGAAGQAINIAVLKPCAYILWLTATLKLTDGYTHVYGTFDDHIAFCKHA